ncbi:MAG: efflux RND transporter periplasmic adaptor subunit [Alphaproteobacteria bacterium]|nr:efflux RND transporter periplasmic adaptor subunit [Alphaproteobacteria bacterium]MBU2085227.1 efflux RND transporter periplasmic adaptor subunit [Alphaproteobacteria bacterium]MBU2142157.1 efflux RND transporter periplasmic adaptor subunit [Alphaproteobacteria bacterium]MBU2197049.1 efflux RND transporter periplasmic adaptor subunit [Alphaproteobacteria bacterium]
MPHFSNNIRALLATALFGAVAACGPSGQETAPQAPPAPAVDIMVVHKTSVESTRELPGRARAYREAEIRPQVTGLIQSRLFTEGQMVTAGQALYQIDAAEYAATVNSAKAALQRAEATAEAARQTASRYQRLSEINAVSRENYDQAVAAQRQAEADVAMQKATVQSASINLARTKVTSPIAGQIGRSTVTPGALVTANQATALANVLQLDPIYIDLTAGSSKIQEWKRDVAEGRIQSTDGESVDVKINLENGTVYSEPGRLEFSEVSVDETAGSVIIRAVVPNPEGLLLPGMYLNASFSAGAYENVYVLPQAAVSRDAKGNPTAMVASAENTVEVRNLTIIEASGSDWIVSEGLEDGDRLIVSGFQKIQPGGSVTINQPMAETAGGVQQPGADMAAGKP